MAEFDSTRKKTYTPYWDQFSTTPKKYQKISLFLRKIKKKIKNIFPFSLKIKVYKQKDDYDEMFSSYQTNKKILSYRNSLLVESVAEFLKYFKLNFSKKDIQVYVDQYCKVFAKTPIRDMNSGFGFNEGLFLFCIIKVIKPTLVIESGVMKGFTTYLINAATDNDCVINCYDISFENIQYKSNKASYFQHDINQNPPDLKNHKTLAFWDDHTSQLDRLNFSIQNHIKYNIFDDDLSFLNFHSDGWPPIPSITMLHEIEKGKINTNEVSWVSRGRKGKMWISRIINKKAVKHVKEHKKFKNLFPITGYKSHSECSFVTLK